MLKNLIKYKVKMSHFNWILFPHRTAFEVMATNKDVLVWALFTRLSRQRNNGRGPSHRTQVSTC